MLMTSILPFNQLFEAIESNALTALHVTILELKRSSKFDGHEAVYNLLNQRHPENQLTALQFALLNYPSASYKIIQDLLGYGAGTELPISDSEVDFDLETGDSMCTPLWIAIREKYPLEIVELLLDFKANVFFKCESRPFDKDEKCSVIKDNNSNDCRGYSLLHLAVKVSSNVEIVKMLCDSSNSLLLNDHENETSSTPLITATEGNNLELVKTLKVCGADLMIRSGEGLTIYEIASKNHFVNLSLFLQEDLSGQGQFYLEVLKSIDSSTWESKTNLKLFGDLDEADELLLPIEGYWEWLDSDWLPVENELEIPERFICRIRRLIEISGSDQFYLKESINFVQSNDHTKALNVLLQGLQQEQDGERKRRAASYFQRLLQRSGTPTLGLLDNLSRSNLVLFNEVDRKNRIHSDEDEESDDSLIYCPVCSYRFKGEKDDRQFHLKSCLKSPSNPLIANRYTRTAAGSVEGECPICYEDLKSGTGSVVMNCLCKFHEKCIDEWLGRGKWCPFHQE